MQLIPLTHITILRQGYSLPIYSSGKYLSIPMWTKEQARKYRQSHKEQIYAYNKKYVSEHKDFYDTYNKLYKIKYADRLKKQARLLAMTEGARIKRRARENAQVKNDPMFRLSCNMGTLMYLSLRENKGHKKWQNMVGYSLETLKSHLEKQFKEGMSWDNYGSGWHVDHIMPRSFFKFISHKSEEFKKCWSLDNLQPLWARDNIIKKNKLPNGSRLVSSSSVEI